MTKSAYILSVIASGRRAGRMTKLSPSLAGDCFLVPRRNDVIVIFVVVLTYKNYNTKDRKGKLQQGIRLGYLFPECTNTFSTRSSLPSNSF